MTKQVYDAPLFDVFDPCNERAEECDLADTFWEWKRKTIPKLRNAYSWSHRSFSNGPLNIVDYNDFCAQGLFATPEDARHHLRVRARTTLGWYLNEWYIWLRGGPNTFEIVMGVY